VIEPPEPYGMPLNLTTLPQKLKEAGKIVVYSCPVSIFRTGSGFSVREACVYLGVIILIYR